MPIHSMGSEGSFLPFQLSSNEVVCIGGLEVWHRKSQQSEVTNMSEPLKGFDHIPGLGDQEVLADPLVKQLVFVAVSFEACEPTGFPDL